MARKIDIRLFNGYAFEDSNTQTLEYDYDGEHPFGMFGVEEKKILGIFDYQISTEHIEYIKNEPMFYEVCDFAVWDMDKKIADFSGSFVDVFSWLMQNRPEYLVGELKDEAFSKNI